MPVMNSAMNEGSTLAWAPSARTLSRAHRAFDTRSCSPSRASTRPTWSRPASLPARRSTPLASEQEPTPVVIEGDGRAHAPRVAASPGPTCSGPPAPVRLRRSTASGLRASIAPRHASAERTRRGLRQIHRAFDTRDFSSATKSSSPRRLCTALGNNANSVTLFQTHPGHSTTSRPAARSSATM